MFHTYFPPHPALLEYVDSVTILNIDFRTRNSLSPICTFVPTHTRFLCFYLHDPVKVKKQDGDFVTCARSIIIGPQLTPVTLDLGQKHHTVIVYYSNMTWIDIAYRCGYYDQMHLIRDFKFFAGFTPGMLEEEGIIKSVRFQKLAD